MQHTKFRVYSDIPYFLLHHCLSRCTFWLFHEFRIHVWVRWGVPFIRTHPIVLLLTYMIINSYIYCIILKIQYIITYFRSLIKIPFTNRFLKSFFPNKSFSKKAFPYRMFSKKAFPNKSFFKKAFLYRMFSKKAFPYRMFSNKAFPYRMFSNKDFPNRMFSNKDFPYKMTLNKMFIYELFSYKRSHAKSLAARKFKRGDKWPCRVSNI